MLFNYKYIFENYKYDFFFSLLTYKLVIILKFIFTWEWIKINVIVLVINKNIYKYIHIWWIKQEQLCEYDMCLKLSTLIVTTKVTFPA